MSVWVPQKDGEVRIGLTGSIRSWRVDDHVVVGATLADERELLLLIPGAKRLDRDRPRVNRTPARKGGRRRQPEAPAS